MQDVRNRRQQLLRRESCRVMLLKSVSPHSGGYYVGKDLFLHVRCATCSLVRRYLRKIRNPVPANKTLPVRDTPYAKCLASVF